MSWPSFKGNGILKVVKEFYDELFLSDVQPQIEERTELTVTLSVTKNDTEETLKGMKRRKALGEGGISIDFIKDIGEIAGENFQNFYVQFFKEGRLSKTSEKWSHCPT